MIFFCRFVWPLNYWQIMIKNHYFMLKKEYSNVLNLELIKHFLFIINKYRKI